eukprot:SAG31_NODE_420_length_15868_cov_11.896823_8_plen_2386_part_00
MDGEQKTVVLCFPTDREFVEEHLSPALNSRLFLVGQKDDASLCISSADVNTMDTYLKLIRTCAKLVLVASSTGMASVGVNTSMHMLLGEFGTTTACPLRQGRSLSSPVIGEIEPGALITVSDAAYIDGEPQLLCEGVFGRGWAQFDPNTLVKKGKRQASQSTSEKQSRRPRRRAPRRHSVAEDGVGGVSALGAEVAKSLGVAAEEVFSIAQKHIPKAPTLVQLKVGGMGLTLFDGAHHLESHNYSSIISWQLNTKEKKFTIVRKDKKPSNITFEYIGEAGDQISELMSSHCQQVKRAQKALRRQKSAAPTTPRTLSDEEISEDDGSESSEPSTSGWWMDDIRRTGDKLNLIEEPCVQRMLVARKDRNVFFSGEVTDVKQDNKRYVAFLTHTAIYFMAFPGPPKDKTKEWVAKSRIRLHRLQGVVLSEAIDDQMMLKAETADGTEVRRYISLCDDRRDQFVNSLSKQYLARVGTPLDVTETHEAFGKAAATSVMGSAFTMETYQDRSVTRQHASAELTFTLIIGLNGTVMSTGRGKVGSARPLYPEDYTQIVTKKFPAAGSRDTLPHEYRDFTFSMHAPEAFVRLREKLGVDTSDYISAFLGVKTQMSDSPGLNPLPEAATLLEMSTNSKSGAFFFFTPDMRFLVKTVGHDEAQTLTDILPDYLQHYEKHADSLINPIVGLYSTNLSKEPFIVMMNAFPLNKGIAMHEVYDLKGSMHGREIKEKEKSAKVIIYKDNDFDRNPQRAFKLGSDRYGWFLNLLEQDVGFLRDHGLIDYSLLVGIHFKQKGSTIDYGGNHIPSRDNANEVYYIGIIDFLIKYHMKKKMEGNIRGAMVNMKNKNKDMKFSALSVTHPDEYSARMLHFINSKTPNPAMMSARRRSSAFGVTFGNQPTVSPTAPAGGGRRRSGLPPSMGDMDAAAAALTAMNQLPMERSSVGTCDLGEPGTGRGKGQGASLGSIAEDLGSVAESADQEQRTGNLAASKISAHAGTYRVLNLCVARESAELSSAKTVELQKGAVINVTESCVTTDDVTRLKFDGGWVTLRYDLLERDNETSGDAGHSRSARLGTGGRRASVAVDGVEGVTNDFNEISKSMGMAGEKVFMVTQNHTKKASALVHLKVGGMGISLFDGPQLIESCIYTQILKWSVQDHGNELVIEFSNGSRSLSVRSAEAKFIAQHMETHASSMANANLLASPHKDLVGEYRVVSETPLFNNYRTDTAECGVLAVGDVVVATDSGSTERSIWLKCDQGWFPRDDVFVTKLSTRVSDAALPIKKLTRQRSSVKDLNALHSERSATDITERIFEVSQSHLKKIHTNVQLKVGGMGVHLFDGEKIIQSFLYTDLVSWQFSKLREEVYISERGGMTIRLGTIDGDAIGALMSEYAMKISEAKDGEKSQSAASAKANLLGQYTVLESTWACKTEDLHSSKLAQLQEADVITVVDALSVGGLTRLKCGAGWVSLKPHTLEKHINEDSEAENSRKGHSVAVHGVQTVANDMNNVATQMGLTGEQVYRVTQTHIRKAPRNIDMKVGGMGVTFFDPRGSVILESYLYHSIQEWQYCRVQNHFILTIKTGRGASEKRNVRLGMTLDQAIVVGNSMTRHAKGIKKATSRAKAMGGVADDGNVKNREEKLKEYYDSITPGTPEAGHAPKNVFSNPISEKLNEAEIGQEPVQRQLRSPSLCKPPTSNADTVKKQVYREGTDAVVDESSMSGQADAAAERSTGIGTASAHSTAIQGVEPSEADNGNANKNSCRKISLEEHMRSLGLDLPDSENMSAQSLLGSGERSDSAPDAVRAGEVGQRSSSNSCSPSPRFSRSTSATSLAQDRTSSPSDLEPIQDDDELCEKLLSSSTAPKELSALLMLFQAAAQRLNNDSKSSICVFLGEYIDVPLQGKLLKQFDPKETFILSSPCEALLGDILENVRGLAQAVHMDPQRPASAIQLATQILLPEPRISGPLKIEGLSTVPSQQKQLAAADIEITDMVGKAGHERTTMVPPEKYAEQVQAAALAQQRARVLEQQLEDLSQRHNAAAIAWTAQRAQMLVSSTAGSIDLQTTELQQENTRLEKRVKELLSDLSLQSELHAAVIDVGNADEGETDAVARDEALLAELTALREENVLLKEQSAPATIEFAAAQVHVAELRQELAAQHREKAQLVAETGQLHRQINRHIEEKELAMRQMRELQGSYRDMLLLKDTLSNGSSPPSSPPTLNGQQRQRGTGGVCERTGSLSRARNSAETVRRQVDSLERELRELVLMPPAALAVAPRRAVSSRQLPRSPSVTLSPRSGSLIDAAGCRADTPALPEHALQETVDVRQLLADCGLCRFSDVLEARGLLSAERLAALGMGELGALGLDTTEKIVLKRALRHAFGIDSPSPRSFGPHYSTSAVGGEV